MSGAFKIEVEGGGYTDPSCVPAGSTATQVTKTVVTASFRVTEADKTKMCGNMDEVAESMQATLCRRSELSACPTVTASSDDCSRLRARRLSETVLFSVDFAVATDSMSSDEQAGLTAVLTDLSTNTTFQEAIQSEVNNNADLGVTVEVMAVSAPKTVVEYTVTTPGGESGGGSDDGGSPILIIVGLLLLLGLGFGAWKMKQGSS